MIFKNINKIEYRQEAELTIENVNNNSNISIKIIIINIFQSLFLRVDNTPNVFYNKGITWSNAILRNFIIPKLGD